MSAKWKSSRAILLLAISPSALIAQGVMPSPNPGATPTPAPTTIAVPRQSNQYESQTLLAGSDKVFDTDSDSIDFEET